MTEPKISVIIPVYNAEPYLRRCLDSVIGQTHKNLEIILINDGSTDNSGAICDEYAEQDPRFRLIHTENRGVYAARNTALDCATGHYIGFVDSDDWLSPEMYKSLLHVLLRYNADIAQCQIKNEGSFQQLEDIQLGEVAMYTDDQLIPAMFRGEITHGLINKLFHAEIWKRRRFNETCYHVDAMEISKIAEYCSRFVRIDDALYHYNTTNNSITRGKKTHLHLRSREALFACFEAASAALPEGSFYICREIPSSGGIFFPGNGLTKKDIYQHVSHMHSIFQRHWPIAKKTADYAAAPTVKKLLWHIYSISPHLAYNLSKLRFHIRPMKGL